MRVFGYACDNLLAAEVVLADGSRVRASEQENADLFWGLRGGGGNFGVVTAFEYRLHPVGPTVLAGPIIYPLDQVREVTAFQRDFMRDAPDEIAVLNAFLTVPPIEPFPEPLHGQKMLFVVPFYAGSVEEGEHALAPLRAAGHSIADAVAPIPYVALQQSLDGVLPRGVRAWSRYEYLRDLEDDAMSLMADHFTRAPGPQTVIVTGRLGGALDRVTADATAAANRGKPYFAWVIGAWLPDQPAEPGIAWTRGVSEALQPFAVGGTYVNALPDVGNAQVHAAYPPQTYERLVTLKRTYDPGNLFHLNQNIEP